jgi:hypothetical protein
MQAVGEGYREGDVERFGVGPAVVLGQVFAEAAGPVRHGAVADLAAGDRQLGDGHRETAGDGLLIYIYDAGELEWSCPEPVPRALHAA